MTVRNGLQAENDLPAKAAENGAPEEARSPMSRIIAVLLLLLAGSLPLAAQQKDNLERLRRCAEAVADSALREYAAGDTITLEVAPHPAAWLLESTVLTRAAARGVGVVSSPAAGRLALAITSIGVEYRETGDADLLDRQCRLAAEASLSRTGRQGERLARSFSAILQDTVGIDETSSLEASGYDFTRGALPAAAGGGFWKTVVEPAVVLGASVVITILLFTVRSQ